MTIKSARLDAESVQEVYSILVNMKSQYDMGTSGGSHTRPSKLVDVLKIAKLLKEARDERKQVKKSDFTNYVPVYKRIDPQNLFSWINEQKLVADTEM